MGFTPLGPGTLTFTFPNPAAGSPEDFMCEILGGKVTHAYTETGAKRTMLCGTVRPATKNRGDGLVFKVENDLTEAGLYNRLLANDLASVPFTYTPNTAGAASWAGTVEATLPPEVGADEFGQPIASETTLPGVGTFTFTPATSDVAV